MSAPVGTVNLGHGIYQGQVEVVDDYYKNPHGFGVEKAYFREFKGRYEHGEMKLGVLNHNDVPGEISGTFGSGTNHNVINYNNGCTYKGQTQHYTPHGKGSMEYKNGDRYVGNFLEGKRHGYGELTSVNGNRKGQWLNDKFCESQ